MTDRRSARAKKKLWLMDTCVLLELLKVPMESANHEEESKNFQKYAKAGDEIQLPVAVLVECGTHILKVSDGGARRRCAEKLKQIIELALEGTTPWRFRPFTWNEDLTRLVVKGHYPRYDMIQSLSEKYIEMGDMMIASEYLALRDNVSADIVDVDVWTRDQKLRLVIDHLRDS